MEKYLKIFNCIYFLSKKYRTLSLVLFLFIQAWIYLNDLRGGRDRGGLEPNRYV